MPASVVAAVGNKAVMAAKIDFALYEPEELLGANPVSYVIEGLLPVHNCILPWSILDTLALAHPPVGRTQNRCGNR
jgi:hypothetical protein